MNVTPAIRHRGRRSGEPPRRLAQAQRDIATIVRVQGARLDRLYLREGAAVLGVPDLLERAFSEAPPED